jgi:hypothetical protein
MLTAFKASPIFRQIADKPDALAAIGKFAQILQSKGFLRSIPLILLGR